MKFEKLAVSIMPIVFMASSVMFDVLQSKIYASACFILAIIFAIVLLGEALKNE